MIAPELEQFNLIDYQEDVFISSLGWWVIISRSNQPKHIEETKMSTEEVLLNQKTILANQKTIITNKLFSQIKQSSILLFPTRNEYWPTRQRYFRDQPADQLRTNRRNPERANRFFKMTPNSSPPLHIVSRDLPKRH